MSYLSARRVGCGTAVQPATSGFSAATKELGEKGRWQVRRWEGKGMGRRVQQRTGRGAVARRLLRQAVEAVTTAAAGWEVEAGRRGAAGEQSRRLEEEMGQWLVVAARLQGVGPAGVPVGGGQEVKDA
jgi:hypothetical protein